MNSGVWETEGAKWTEVLPYFVPAEQETNSYIPAAAWLDGCGELVRDWGCGFGYARRYFSKSRYEGVDAWNALADRKIDLHLFHEQSDGILIRYVLEHADDWRLILRNAVAAFQKRMVVVIATPLHGGPVDRNLGDPDGRLMSLPERDVLRIVGPHLVREERRSRPCPAPHSMETLFYLEKKDEHR